MRAPVRLMSSAAISICAVAIVCAAGGARAGDAAAEAQRAAAVVQQGLAGRGAPEPARLASIVIADEGHAGDRRGGFPEAALDPRIVEAFGLEEDDVGTRTGTG